MKYLYDRPKKNYIDLNVWIAYPGLRSFGLSALGFMFICKTFDMMPNINFEAIFTDTTKTSIFPNHINMIGFSFSFDFDFLNILQILDKYNIPLKNKERNSSNPFIFGGGPVLTSNPEPYFEIFDFIILGDGEGIYEKITNIIINNKDKQRNEILKKLSNIEGIYVPTYPKEAIKKLTCSDIKIISTPILSEESFFSNTYVIEIERGCSNRCGFCLASYINMPIRFLEYDEIIKEIDNGLKYTNKIALLGAMIAKHPRFNDICTYIYDKVQKGECIELSFSSLRVDNISETAIKTLVACGQKHSTIAIEAASERLRKVINKNITEEQIFDCIDICNKNGLKGLKIYAMLGLPTETTEDIEAFIVLSKKIKEKFKGFNISFGFSTFVPKPHTPFQWCKRESIKTLKEKQNFLKKELHKLGIKADFSSPKWDEYQYILSTGSRVISDKIFDIYKNGGSSSAFKKYFKNIVNDYYIDDVLPWDFITINPKKEFLKSEYKKLLKL